MKYIFAIMAICLLAGSVLAIERYVVEPGKIENGKDLAPYNTWTNAATNIQWAVDVATNSETVWVSNGTYYCQESVMGKIQVPASTAIITNRAMIVISNTITLKSVNGAANTIIDGNYPLFTNRCVGLAGNKAILDGFTIQHGRAQPITAVEQAYPWNGGGVWLSVGANGVITATVQNCIIRENSASSAGGGIEVYNSYGTISNCQVICNTQNVAAASASAGGGGIILSSAGTVLNCIIKDNKTDNNGGGILARSQNNVIRNCLIARNIAVTGGAFYVPPGAVAYASQSTIENCTFVSNRATSFAGGFSQSNTDWTVRNTIIWSNSAPLYSDCYPGTGTFNNCCMSDTNNIVFGSRNITNHPLFVDFAGDNYRLAANSPCMNTGTNRSWMTNGIDLDGLTRIRYGTVDMGAYETIFNGTIFVIP